MTTPDDFFAADGPERDRYGRPLLLPRGESEKKPYTRASSLSDYLADFSHLWKWKMRYLARSLGQNPDLAALAGAECYTTGFDKGDEKENRASGRRLDEVIERALDRGQISVKADYGTVIHALTEPGNDGHVAYENADKDVASFWQSIKDLGIVLLGTELFTANDDLMVAGTFDHLAYVPGYGIVIVDKKTSSAIHGEDFRIQLSTYANADLYDWETDRRQSLEAYVAALGWDPDLINRDVGFIIWIKNGKTEWHRLDLKAGYEAAKVATWVRDNHRKGKHSWPADADIAEAKADAQEQLLSHISVASLAGLDTLWRLWGTSIWTDEHTRAAIDRKGSL